MSAAIREQYTAANEAFYASFWQHSAGYRSRWPNAEEAARAGAVLSFVGRISEREPDALTLLDVGCGRGWLTNLLSLYGDASGCDLAEGGLHLARRLFPNVTFHHGSVTELIEQRRLSPVHVVVSSEVIEHVPHVFKGEFVAGLRRALLPLGHCIITTPRQEMFEIAGSSSSQLVEEWSTELHIRQVFTQQAFLCRGFARVHPVGGTLAERLTSRVERSLTCRAPAWLRAWLDWHSALYQVWWFQRTD